MREMTSAEFTRVNLTKLDAPVTIKRYTKVIGTYYPEGTEPPVEAYYVPVAGKMATAPVVEPRVIVEGEPELDMVTMFRYIAAELRDIRTDLPCPDPLFHEHE